MDRKAEVVAFDATRAESARSRYPNVFPDVAALIAARAPEHPTLCFSPARARASARAFQSGFPGLTTYAVKSNPTPELVRAFAAEGITAFDVASTVEMELVRGVLPTAVLHYNNPIRSDHETDVALKRYAVRHFVVDDREGFERLAAHVDDPAKIEVSVRIRPARNMALHDFRSKFGAEPEDAAPLLSEIDRRGFRTGLTFHPGSQCGDPAAFVALVFDAAGVAREAGVAPTSLNVGGGFPARYRGGDAPELDRYFRDIGDAFARTFDPDKTRLVAEPGRALCAPTMSLLAEVKHRRANGDVFLNDGIYGSLMELSQIPIEPPVLVRRGPHILTGPAAPVRVYGPTCDPLDVLPKPVPLPEDIRPGDRIEFGMMGAYSSATITSFNGYGRIETATVERILGAR
ncbi:ornithine decarboxylase [Rhodobium orientis]|nr:type III PLP-dependent enzyme [Rhodobium orientis]MBB4301583.1 ornithine decarboxylase [Rhodobium orientis]